MKISRTKHLKIAAACLVLSFFLLPPARVGAAPAPANTPGYAGDLPAAKQKGSAEGGEQAAVSLEQAIVIARDAFRVPESLDQFSSGFNQSEDMAFWELRWYGSKQQGGEMTVRVNAVTGEVWSMYRWLPAAPGQVYRGLPKYTREQAAGIAAALAKKLQPERFQETILQPASHNYVPLALKEREQVEYFYNYARKINGVAYQENGINVGVSGDTGEVVRFEVTWEKDISKFPATAGCITQEQARQVFRTDGTELIYLRPFIPGGREVPVKLVYRLNGLQTQLVIDAFTGKVRKDEGFSIFYDRDGGGGMGEAANQLKAPALTQAEEVAVEEAKNLLPREKALAAALSACRVPPGFTLESSRLEQDYYFKDQKTWRFNWQNEDDKNRKGIDVSVDAVSGELVSFNHYDYSYDYSEAPQVKLSEAEALKVAEDFIKKAQPAKWEQVVFDTSLPELAPVPRPAEQPLPRSYSFNWVRQVKGVKFPANGFYLNIDSATGEVKSYRMTWWNVDFPEPQGVIGEEAAAGKFLLDSPLTLSYKKLYSRSDPKGLGDPEVSLVYFLVLRNYAMLDAFTGQRLDSGGRAAALPVDKINFLDMENSPAREAVETLARFGVVDAAGDYFRPGDVITQAELITMLVRGNRPQSAALPPDPAGSEPWYQPYYDEAARMGIIEAGEKPDPGAPVTREALAGRVVQAMGYSKVARLSDIFILNCRDAGEVSESLKGHAAISAALGLIEPVDGKFAPKAPVTRAEAAVTVLKLLQSGAGNN